MGRESLVSSSYTWKEESSAAMMGLLLDKHESPCPILLCTVGLRINWNDDVKDKLEAALLLLLVEVVLLVV